MPRISDQGTEVEFTVAQKLNQSCPGNGGNYCRGPFLGTFLGKQKGTNNFF